LGGKGARPVGARLHQLWRQQMGLAPNWCREKGLAVELLPQSADWVRSAGLMHLHALD